VLVPAVYTLLGTAAATILNDLVQQLRLGNSHKHDLKIMISLQEIESQKRSYVPIICSGYVGTIMSQFYVHCGRWGKLILSEKEKRAGIIDLMDHLSELTQSEESSSQKEKFGLVTYQNGINNTKRDFYQKSQWITQNLPEQPLSIGLFNPSLGKSLPGPTAAIPDLYRMSEEKVYNTDTLVSTWRLFVTLATRLPKKQNFLWLHIAHSEGSILANFALTNKLTPKDQQNYFKEHLYVLTYGAVMPVPLPLVSQAINTYSDKDITWKTYGEKFRGNRTYNIKVVSSKVPPAPWPQGDHDFIGFTYKEQLTKNLASIREEYEIYAK
jgi:hypothetical protein